MDKEKIRLGDIIEYEDTCSTYEDVGWGIQRGIKVAEDIYCSFLLVESRKGKLGFEINNEYSDSEVFEEGKWYTIEEMKYELGTDWKIMGNILEFSHFTYLFKDKLKNMEDKLEKGEYLFKGQGCYL